MTLALTIVTEGIVTFAGDESVALTDLDLINVATKFKVSSESPIAGYLYVAIVAAEDNVVHVVYPPSTPQSISAGQPILVPDDSSWLTAPVEGALRVVIANQPVAANEWPVLGDGRDGDAHRPTGSEGLRSTGAVDPTPPRTPPK